MAHNCIFGCFQLLFFTFKNLIISHDLCGEWKDSAQKKKWNEWMRKWKCEKWNPLENLKVKFVENTKISFPSLKWWWMSSESKRQTTEKLETKKKLQQIVFLTTHDQKTDSTHLKGLKLLISTINLRWDEIFFTLCVRLRIVFVYVESLKFTFYGLCWEQKTSLMFEFNLIVSRGLHRSQHLFSNSTNSLNSK